jgi:predicted secreted protein
MSGGMGEQQPDGSTAEVPQKPDGDEEKAQDAAPETPDSMQPEVDGTLSLSDLSVDDMVSVVLNETGEAVSVTVLSMDGNMGMNAQPGGMPGGEMPGGGMPGGGMPGGGSSGVDEYTAVHEYSEDTVVDGESISSVGADENAVLVNNGAAVTLSNDTIDRTSSDSTGGDNSSFYGVGAAVLATDGTVSVTDSTITTDAAGGAGLFAYGSGTVYAADSVITTLQNTSGGIHAAGGGTLYAWDLDVTTNGESAAAIRSDRGGGTMVVDGGTYTSNGIGSPAVYCTADIAVNNAVLTATGSEAICIEGLNTLNLFNCDLSGAMKDDSRNDCTWTVIVYQSMSGDSELGNGTFEMDGGTLTSGNGGLFYTTNTECTITLKEVTIVPSDTNEFFLRCSGNDNERGWGTAGQNGSDCCFTAIAQEMSGDIIWDSVSQLDFYMTEGSSLTGAVVDDETYSGNGGSGYANLYLSSDSVWTVTGDSILTALYNEGTIVDAEGNKVSVIGTDGTEYVTGTSDYSITVENYSTSADFSGASGIADWSAYETERPAL